MPRARRAALVALSLGVIAACEFPEERPSIRIVTPEDGATNDSSSLLVTIEVDRFTITDETFDDPREDDSRPYYGHWHLYVTPRDTAGNLVYERTIGYDVLSESALLTDLAPGEPQIAAELVNQNHTHIQGVDLDFVDVLIPADAPRIEILEPNDLDAASTSVELEVAVANFVLDTNIGGPNAPGRGHYHVYVGGLPDPVLEAATEQVTLTDLVPVDSPPPFAEIYVELVANDHSSLATPVIDATFVEISPGDARMALLSPSPGAVVGTSFGVTLDLAAFTLVDYTTTVTNADGQGHYHVLVDGVDVGEDWRNPSVVQFPIPPGAHEIRVELRANDHDAIWPAAVDTALVTSTGG